MNYLYSGDWLDAFLEKPRLRINGVYISRLNYLRTGYGESYNQPIHVVSYFRYIRFFNDGENAQTMNLSLSLLALHSSIHLPLPVGKVLLLTSTTEPSMVVKSLTPALKMSGLMKGTFEWAGHQAHLTLKDPERPGCVFYCTLSGM